MLIVRAIGTNKAYTCEESLVKDGRTAGCGRRLQMLFIVSEAVECGLRTGVDHYILAPVKQDSQPALPCSDPAFAGICPLSKVRAGSVVCVRELLASPEVSTRLRELGIIEESQITLLSRETNLICVVCNARLGLSHKLGESILVQELPAERTADIPC